MSCWRGGKDYVVGVSASILRSRFLVPIAGVFLTWGCMRSTYDQELAEDLRRSTALSDAVGIILKSATRGEINGLLVQNLPEKPRSAILSLIPDKNAHVLVESNEFVHGVFIFYGPRVDTGFCAYTGNAAKLKAGRTRTIVSSNVFVFQRL